MSHALCDGDTSLQKACERNVWDNVKPYRLLDYSVEHSGARTHDILLAGQALYQLSYDPK